MGSTSGFSICMWFKVNFSGIWSRIFDFGNWQTDNQNLLLADFEGRGVLIVHRYLPCNASDGVTPFVFPTPISYGQWRHVCIVNQAKNWFFYDNGVLQGSDRVACNLGNIVLASNYLGRSNWGVDPLLRGSIAEFRIYNRVLYASEVTALYANIGTISLLLVAIIKQGLPLSWYLLFC